MDVDKVIDHRTSRSYVACDTETTGTALFHGCLPFYTSCFSPEEIKTWDHHEFINPQTREINYPTKHKGAIGGYLHKFDLWVFHNAKFDIRALLKAGLMNCEQLDWSRVHDTFLMAHVLDSAEKHGLKELALKYLNILDDDEKDLEKATKSGRLKAKKLGWKIADEKWAGSFKEIWRWDYWIAHCLDPFNTLCENYCIRDTERTLKLFIVFRSALLQEGLWQQYLDELTLLRHVFLMEEKGVGINLDTIREKEEAYLESKATATKVIAGLAKKYGMEDFNPASGPQLKMLLFDHLKHKPVKFTDKGNPSLDADSLDEMQKEASLRGRHIAAQRLQRILDIRQADGGLKYTTQYQNTAISSFHRNGDGRDHEIYTIHASANQCGTGTTRFAMNNPNLQNVGKGDEDDGGLFLRPIFIPKPGMFWYDIDYMNLELRLFAWMSGDKRMQRAFLDGYSVMMLIARELWGKVLPEDDDGAKKTQQYRWTKNFVYCVLYGGGRRRADLTLGKEGGYDLFKKRFPTVPRFSQACMDEAREHGYITTLFGYRLYVDKNQLYAATDYKIQGTAGGVFKRGLVNAAVHLEEYEPRMYPILPVHDEVVYEGPIDLMHRDHNLHNRKTLQGIKQGMELPGKEIGIPTPVEIDLVTEHWGHRKAVNV